MSSMDSAGFLQFKRPTKGRFWWGGQGCFGETSVARRRCSAPEPRDAHSPALRPETTLRLAAEEVRRLIQDTELCVKERASRAAADNYAVRWRLDTYLANGVGRARLGQALRQWVSWAEAADREDWMVRSALLLAAIERFRLATGQLPERLDDLVPRFMKAVPLDPYDGKPLRYSREAGIIHSVGTDFLDDGGSAVEDDDRAWWDEEEPTLRLRR